MTSPTFTPPPEMVEAIREMLAREVQARFHSQLSMEEVRSAAWAITPAAIAVLAPMIGEECAKEASEVSHNLQNARRQMGDLLKPAVPMPDVWKWQQATADEIEARIRSKFPSATGEKGK